MSFEQVGQILERIGEMGDSAGERLESGGFEKLNDELATLLEKSIWDLDTQAAARALVNDMGQAAGITSERVEQEVRGGFFAPSGSQVEMTEQSTDAFRKAAQNLSDEINDRMLGIYDEAEQVIEPFERALGDDVMGAYRKGWHYPYPVEYGALTTDDILQVQQRITDMDNLMTKSIKPDVMVENYVDYPEGTFGPVGQVEEDGGKWITDIDGSSNSRQTAVRSMNTQFREYLKELDLQKGSNLGNYFNGAGDFGFGKNMEDMAANIDTGGEAATKLKAPYQPVKNEWMKNAMANKNNLIIPKADLGERVITRLDESIDIGAVKPSLVVDDLNPDFEDIIGGQQEHTPFNPPIEQDVAPDMPSPKTAEADRLGGLDSPEQKAELDAMKRAMIEMQPISINENLFAEVSDNVDELLNKPSDPDLGNVGGGRVYDIEDPPPAFADYPINERQPFNIEDAQAYGERQSSAANSWAKKVWNKMTESTKNKLLSALGITTITGGLITAIVYSAGAGSSVGGSGGGGVGIPPTTKPDIPPEDKPKKDPDDPDGDDSDDGDEPDEPDEPDSDEPESDDESDDEDEDDEEPPEMPDFWGRMKDGTMKKLRWVKNKLYEWGGTMWEWKGTIGSGITLVGGWIYKGGQALYELTGKALDNAKTLFAFYAAYKLFNNPAMFFVVAGLAAYYLYKK